MYFEYFLAITLVLLAISNLMNIMITWHNYRIGECQRKITKVTKDRVDIMLKGWDSQLDAMRIITDRLEDLERGSDGKTDV